jgi:hypothetical protein
MDLLAQCSSWLTCVTLLLAETIIVVQIVDYICLEHSPFQLKAPAAKVDNMECTARAV